MYSLLFSVLSVKWLAYTRVVSAAPHLLASPASRAANLAPTSLSQGEEVPQGTLW